MKKLLSTFGAVALLILCTTDAKAQELPAVFSAEIRDDLRDPPIRDFMGEVNTAFFNVQGDDDDFVVYSLVDFDTTSIDTSGGTVSGISSLTLDLSQANAVFSTSGDLAFFLASDTRAVEVTDTARFMSDRANGGANTGADVVGSAFGTLFPLGTGTYTVGMDFDVDSFALSLDADGQAFAASQINSGGVLRIIATPADTVVQATYAGEGIFFGDPPLPPVLNVTVSTGGVIEVLKGDVDTDGDVDFGDIPAFIGVLQSGVFQAEADVDCSGGIDFSDIPAFIQVLQGQ